MSNTFFQFKQFTIQQEHCAMKVCTDACLFGAWLAGGVHRWRITDGRVLDIGAGTGLLSMMLAQQTDCMIDAVELDEKAAEQAADNFEASPWHQHCQLIQADIRTVHLGRKYGLIISNPPFYQNDLKSGDDQRNIALHSKELSLFELLAAIKKHLSANGKFAVLLPYHRRTEFENMAMSAGFFLAEAVLVKQSEMHDYFRVMLLFNTTDTTCSTDTINIMENGLYSNTFTELLQPYYLKL